METGKPLTIPSHAGRPLLLGIESPLLLGGGPDATSVRDLGLVLGPGPLLHGSSRNDSNPARSLRSTGDSSDPDLLVMEHVGRSDERVGEWGGSRDGCDGGGLRLDLLLQFAPHNSESFLEDSDDFDQVLLALLGLLFTKAQSSDLGLEKSDTVGQSLILDSLFVFSAQERNKILSSTALMRGIA